MKKLFSILYVFVFLLNCYIWKGIDTNSFSNEKLTIKMNDNILRNTTYRLTLNELKTIEFNGEVHNFSFQAIQNQMYVVETTGKCDTLLRVQSDSIGTITDDNSGIDNNARIYFTPLINEEVKIYSVLSDLDAIGDATIQVRKQKFSLFGYEDAQGNSTIPDLDKPYNDFKDIMNCIKFVNGTEFDAYAIDERGLANLNSELVLLSGHGDKGSGTKGGVFYFKAGTIRCSKPFDMSRTNLAVFAACHSAYGNNDYRISIAEKAIKNGAKTSIGFNDEVSFSSSKTFTNTLFNSLSQGQTVESAAKKAASKLLWPWDKGKQYTIFGNKNNIIIGNNPQSKSILQEKNYTYLNQILPFEHYKSENLNDNIYRYYEIINGVMTNNFVDIKVENDSYSLIVENINFYNNILIKKYDSKNILYQYFSKNNIEIYDILDRHCVYFCIDNNMVPLDIIEVRYEIEEKLIFDYIAVDLYHGNMVDYSVINTF